ncbi:DUF4352 domain-containing protein [Prescottella equi]|uniref:DUF4352 domain-containing protein n=1 Tax=Rhodococcus hoagii TaxID=43767 RepID=UPI000D0EF582|nr:DUF4352 domain-containing protein [Prescottella equi]AVP67732.1 DUF4352 domain-containing protein [Prescottella equi]MBM9836178.1 DUF4352 domain-containing protein [Prescottella equi]NKS54607.1 DUF4352 domain-containing protein [Prescottella equi]BCN62844.1 Mpr protein [Prescottella equi]BCN72697.1 Mpr protein [Prescottella equi]
MNAPQQPFPGQPYPPAPQPPQKKSKKWPWIVGAIAAVVVIGAVSGGGDDEKKTVTAPAPADVAAVGGATPAASAPASAPEPAPAPAPAPKKTVPGMGTPVRDGKFEFVVTDVATGLSTVGDNPFLTEKAQGQFVIVTMTVQNTADKPKGLSPSDQEMYDTQGRKFTADTMAGIALGSDVSVWDEINPGNKVTMKVVFDMPADAVPAEIELHDSMFSGGTRVALQ